jgi:ATP-dependent Clp protease ATP-binding subunit ClpB
LKDKYETHHGVRIKDTAIVAAATLSHRYITDRFLPDKAVDLIDEAASKLRIEIDSLPTEIDEVEREVIQREIERQALMREDDPVSRERLAGVEKEIADLKEKSGAMKAKWQSEKEVIERIRAAKGEIERLKVEAEQFERAGDYGKVAEIRYGRVAELQKQFDADQARLAELQKSGRTLKEEVTEEDVAEVVARWTGVPISKMLEGEMQKLTRMEERLGRRVIGQDDALVAVSNAVRRARAGLQDPKRPIGSFIFLGPTGVGKTELAKALAEFMFGSEDALIKIDMSEFMERHNVSRLVGAPPGYVGFDEGGQLTEAVRRKSYAVVLLDEVEKAHPEVFNILLQILEDGHLSDAKGRRVDFRNCIIIMTSNLGAKQLQTNSSLGFRPQGTDELSRAESSYELMKEKVAAELKNSFRPEFLNRIDATVVFRSLTVEEMAQIVDLMLSRVRDQLRAQQMTLEVTEAAKEHIIKLGYDVAYGARPLRRVIQNMIEDVLAEHLLLGRYEPGTTIVVDKDPEAGLEIHAAESRTPVEAH